MFSIESYIYFNRINRYIIEKCKPSLVVGFLWDDKLRFFAESLDIKPLFCDVNELDGVSIVNRLESVEKFKWRKDIGLFYKQKTNVAIRMFLSKYVVNKENKTVFDIAREKGYDDILALEK